jgi:hypothetical protein
MRVPASAPRPGGSRSGFYQISDGRLCLQLVIGHVSYAGNCNIALFNFIRERIFERGVTIPLPFAPAHARERARRLTADVFHTRRALAFETEENQRRSPPGSTILRRR